MKTSNRQALVGIFTLVGLLITFGVFYVLADFGTRAGGYKIGIHFESAAGLRPGALAYLSGVPVGTVDQIQLLPDYTVDVLVAVHNHVDIPESSKFIISVPLTGEPTLLIVPPRKPSPSLALLPKQVLPLSDQPQGENPATLESLLEQGQGEIKKLDALLSMATQSAPRLMGSLQQTLDNANRLTVKANRAFDRFTDNSQFVALQLRRTIDRVSENLVQMSATLNGSVQRNSTRIDALLASLTAASESLASTIEALHQVAGDPRLHENVIATTKSLANTAAALASVAQDIHQMTGNPQSQAQLRDTVAQIDASSQRLNSILGSFGGHSNVYGVDTGAPAPTPLVPPETVPEQAPPASSSVPGASAAPTIPPNPTPTPTAHTTSVLPALLQARLGGLAKNLINVQVRVSELSKQQVPTATTGNGSSLLTSDRGPQTDMNLGILPHSKLGAMIGANDIGGLTTYNVLGIGRLGAFHVGGGVVYSQPGIVASGENAHLGFETRLYDLRTGILDAYGRFLIGPHIELFGGQRDIFHSDRRNVFGLQATFP